MCESNVYIQEGDAEALLLEDVAWLETDGGQVLMKDILGRAKRADACFSHADLVQHRIVLQPVGTCRSEQASLADRAVGFHGHLGPYLVLGLRMGLLARERLGFEGHFDVRVTAFTGSDRPVSCMVDGLQLSTGATLGKGNISIEPVADERPGAGFETEGGSVRIRLSERALELVRDLEDDACVTAAARRAMEMPEGDLFEVVQQD